MMKITKNDYFSESSARYARALIRLDFKEDDFTNTFNILKDNPELFDVLAHPMVEQEKKEVIIDRIFEGKLEQNFLKLLCKRDKINAFYEIYLAFKYIHMLMSRTLKATLTYIVPPTPDQLKALEAFLMKRHPSKDIDWEMKEDKSLIGGFTIYIDGTLYDYSVDTRLNRLKTNLTGR